jgi:tol-pal system protein YbgF
VKRKTLPTSLVLGLALAGGAGAGQKKEDVLLGELRQIQAQLERLESSQAALKAAVDALTAGAAEQQDSLRKTFADSKIAIDRVQQDMSILSERIDETNSRLGGLREDLLTLRQSREALVVPEAAPAPGEAGSTAQTPPVEASPPPAPAVPAGPSVIDIYNEARNDYTQGRYPLAISGFKDVLELDKKGDLADNAHYWMGESYLAQRQHDLAIGEFDKIIRDYPQSNKRPDAYLKKAMTLEDMGRRSEANVMYELVIEQFPKTPQERDARRKLEDLMRTQPRQP